MEPSMDKLTVLMDSRCGFCWRCRQWLSRQAQFVELEFLSRESKEAQRRFAALGELEPSELEPSELEPSELEPSELEPSDDLVVVADSGDVYRGPDAFIVCLWALKEYREVSLALSSPALRPLARRAFEVVSKRRRTLSGCLDWLGCRTDRVLEECREMTPREPACRPDGCR